MSGIYLLDESQLNVLKRVKHRLYDESRKLGIDEKRDLANAMDAVLHSVETYGALSDEDELKAKAEVKHHEPGCGVFLTPAQACSCSPYNEG